jgi:hypothetical protein
MAKIKPAGKKKPLASQFSKPGFSGGLGCVVLIVSTMLLVFLLMYYVISRA